MKTMSYIANNQAQACMKPCSYPTTINKHHLFFQSKSNLECLFAKKKRLSIRKQGVFQVPHCTISSSSSSSDSKKNDQEDNNFNLDSWISLFNENNKETPSKSKDVNEPPWTNIVLPLLLFNVPKEILLWNMVSIAKEYIGKHVEIRFKSGHDGMSVYWHVGTWKGMDFEISYEFHRAMFLRIARIVFQPLACLKLKIEEIIVLLLEKIAPSVMHNGMAKAAIFNLLLSLLFMAISLILWMNTSV